MKIRFSLLLVAFVLSSQAATCQHIFSVKGSKTYLDNKEFQVIGLRCSNALISDKTTRDLIDHLDLYQSYGINTVSVFLMGSRFGDVKGYNENGSLNDVYSERLGRIITACDKRKMAVLVGCLYWGNSKAKWESWKQEDAEIAIHNTIVWLTENNYRNVFVDPDNEGMAQREAGFDYYKLIEVAKKANPDIMVGYNSRGYPPPNADLALHFSEIVPDIPYIESEGTMTDYWGAYSKEKDLYEYINVGIYTDGKKKEQIQNTDRFLRNGHGYLFASTWLQNVPVNNAPGGDGSPCDPGISWWLNHIKHNYLK